MYQATIVKFDPKTEKFQFWTLPAEANIDAAQINMVSPQSSQVDGKVWTQNNGFAGVHRLDLATGKIETWLPFKTARKGEAHNIYDVIPDSKNNVFFTDFRQGHIGRIDAKTGEVALFPTPTPRSAPRRGNMDAQDRLWFGEYRGDRIGMFDTRTSQFKEWKLNTRWAAPYDVVLDKNEDAWTGSMVTDQVTRLNTKTGEMVDYLLPRSTNIRRVFVDNSTTPVSFWVGSNDGASIVRSSRTDAASLLRRPSRCAGRPLEPGQDIFDKEDRHDIAAGADRQQCNREPHPKGCRFLLHGIAHMLARCIVAVLISPGQATMAQIGWRLAGNGRLASG